MLIDDLSPAKCLGTLQQAGLIEEVLWYFQSYALTPSMIKANVFVLQPVTDKSEYLIAAFKFSTAFRGTTSKQGLTTFLKIYEHWLVAGINVTPMSW